MKLQFISNERYNNLLFKGILGGKGFANEITISDNGCPCIGYNFNLKDPVIVRKVLRAIGFDVDGNQLVGKALVAEKYYIDLILSAFNIVNCRDADAITKIINNIITTRLKDKRYHGYDNFKRIERFVYEEEQDLISSLSSIIAYYDNCLNQWLECFNDADHQMNPQLLLKSKERAVLFGLSYQGLIGMELDKKTPKLKELGQALLSNNRAKSWYIIRYNAFNVGQINNELAHRRYYESELFGLYDVGSKSSNLSSVQCKEIYNMFTENKQHILNHETKFAPGIQAASAQYGVYPGFRIKTLEQSFELVYTHIREMKALNSALLLQKQLEKITIPTLSPLGTTVPLAS